MKTRTNSDSKIYSRNNVIILLVGFLTPVLLFGSLAASMYNKDSEGNPETAQTVEGVAVSTEMYAAPKAYIYKNAHGEDEVEITPDADNICLKGELITPGLNRF